MSDRSTHIALILGDTLRMMGLRELIRHQNEDVTVELFGSLDEFRSGSPDDFDIVYAEDTVIALSGEYLRGKRFYVIPIISGIGAAEARLTADEEVTYLHSRWDYDTLEAAIKDSFRASHVIKESTAEKGLSSREEEVLKEVARGLTNKEIADALNISMNTVMSHRKNITAKLNIKTVSGLTFYALMNNLISGEEVVERASD